MLSPAQAAKRAKLSRTAIMNAIKDQRLKALRGNRGWLIDPDDLELFINSRSDRVVSHLSSQLDETLNLGEIHQLKLDLAVKDTIIAGKVELIEQLRAEIRHLQQPFWVRWFRS